MFRILWFKYILFQLGNILTFASYKMKRVITKARSLCYSSILNFFLNNYYLQYNITKYTFSVVHFNVESGSLGTRHKWVLITFFREIGETKIQWTFKF